MILSDYIEKHINRKISILKWIFENKNRSVTIPFLQENMQESKPTIMKDIDDLQYILNKNNINFVLEKNQLSITNFDLGIKDVGFESISWTHFSRDGYAIFSFANSSNS